MINVTKAYLPDKQKFLKCIDEIYESHWLTNEGTHLRALEARLATYLGVKHVALVSNGTLALQVAFRALDLAGEVVTTPFSFVATTSALVWEGLKPVFADIDPDTLNLAPERVAEKIGPATSAILGVHVYGRPCAVEEFEVLAKKHGIRMIYDAAHAFGVNCGGRSLLTYGDVSTLSFHATKIFHTIEGGAVITEDPSIYRRVKSLINFGLSGPDVIDGLGINCKMNEFQAAMGLCILDEMEGIRRDRASVVQHYRKLIPSAMLPKEIPFPYEANDSYFPVLFADEMTLLQVKARLFEAGYGARRYFYPSLSELSYVERQICPVSEDISRRVLCLPLYPDLPIDAVLAITRIVVGS